MVDVRSIATAAVAVLDQIRAVAKECLKEKLGVVSRAELQAIEDGLREILELCAPLRAAGVVEDLRDTPHGHRGSLNRKRRLLCEKCRCR